MDGPAWTGRPSAGIGLWRGEINASRSDLRSDLPTFLRKSENRCTLISARYTSAHPLPARTLRRFCCLLLCTAAIASCRIEQTPEHFIDNQATPVDEIITAEAEVRRRILALGVAIQRRDAFGVTSALAPHADLIVIGPEDGQLLSTPEEISSSLVQLANNGASISVGDVDVSIFPRMAGASFRTDFTSGAADGTGSEFRFTGVFIRLEGEWRLLQGHISRPAAITPAP